MTDVKLTCLLGCLMPVAAIAQLFGPESIQTDPGNLPKFTYEGKLKQYSRICDGRYLTIDIPEGTKDACCILEVPLDFTQYANRGVRASVMAKSENLKNAEGKGGFSVFGFRYEDPDSGVMTYANSGVLSAGPEFQEVSQWLMLVGKNVKRGFFRFGLWQMTGRVMFDLETLKLGAYDGLFRKINNDFKVKYPEEIMRRRPLRGAMTPAGEITEDDFRTMKEWGMTLIRYQMTRQFAVIGANRDIADFNAFIDGKLEQLDTRILPLAEKYGISVCVCLHVTPGGREKNKELTIYHEQDYLDSFLDIWRRIATRFKGRRNIYGYDLVNEPIQFSNVQPNMDYWNVQRRAAEAIREIDPDVTIVFESNLWDCPATFSYLSPLRMGNVVYQVHMYQPGEFTHQGIFGSKTGVVYPNAEKRWDVNMLRKVLQPVRDFQIQHDAKIYVGEFSAATWAPGAGKYLEDVISVFNEYGWDWTYHAFRESGCWSVEKEGPNSAHLKDSADNDRKRALLKGLRAE